jgi:hypothetical protein
MGSQSTNPGRGSVVQLREDDRSGERSRNALFRQLRRQLKIGKNNYAVHIVANLKYHYFRYSIRRSGQNP